MKRRKVISILAGSLAAPKAQHGSSIYGTPGSIATGADNTQRPLLRLDVNELPMAKHATEALYALSKFWPILLDDSFERQFFADQPKEYLEARGIDSRIFDMQAPEFLTFRAICHDAVINAALRSDYLQFLSALEPFGLKPRGPSAAMTNRALNILTQKLHRHPGIIESAAMPLGIDSIQRLLASPELLRTVIGRDLAQIMEGAVLVNVPVAISALAVVYVSVATNVTVTILAGTYVSAAVSVAAAANGSPLQESRPSNGVRWPAFNLDPSRVRDTHMIANIAAALKNDALALEATRQLITDEVAAVLKAARQLSLVKFDDSAWEVALSTIKSLALNSAQLN